MQTGALVVFLLQQNPAVSQQAGHFRHLLLSGPALQIVCLRNEDKAFAKTSKRVTGAHYWLF